MVDKYFEFLFPLISDVFHDKYEKTKFYQFPFVDKEVSFIYSHLGQKLIFLNTTSIKILNILDQPKTLNEIVESLSINIPKDISTLQIQQDILHFIRKAEKLNLVTRIIE